MNEDGSDCEVRYWDGYDSDKDKEYIPYAKSSRQKIRIKIRGKEIEMSPCTSEISSRSDSLEDEPALEDSWLMNIENVQNQQCILKERSDNIHVLQNVVLSTSKTNTDSENEMKNNEGCINLDRANPEDPYENKDLYRIAYENTINNENPDLEVFQIERTIGKTTSELEESETHTLVYEEANIIEDLGAVGDVQEAGDVATKDNDEEIKQTKRKLSRIKQRNVKEWACNIRKENYDRGKEYISVRKKRVPAREIKTKKDCFSKCIYRCAIKISEEQRKEIFSHYYQLNAQEKKMFILNTTVMTNPERRRKGKNTSNSRKGNAFKYYFHVNNDRIQVCKLFYCGTISISQKPIYTAHKHKTSSNTAEPSIQGKHSKKVTSEESANLVREHINMFPKVPSHYCREKSQKEYLEGDLSIKKMYELYIDFVQEQERVPVKFCIYRNIFCKEFNISFYKPKKDRCDLCAEVDMKKQEGNLTEELKSEYEIHLQEKEAMRVERRKDRDNDVPVLCFDLENVLSCPKAEIKNFFYKSKLSVYNMTAHLSLNKNVYCAIWSEALHGRSGNDIASAVYKILSQVLQEHREIRELILWSDSCVPQNRNSLMSFAVAHIIQKFPKLEKITMKFSVPGHSCVQEVDAVHSAIERSLSKSEYFSPISLLRLLIKVNKRKPYIIKQMLSRDFLDFQSYAMAMNYKEVPFSKVSCLEFTKSFFEVKYKTSFLQPNFVVVNLRPKKSFRKNVTTESRTEYDVPVNLEKRDCKEITLPQTKINALQSMLRWMPEADREYYHNLLPENARKTKKRKLVN